MPQSLASSAASATPEAPDAAPHHLASDTEVKLPSSAHFIAPTGYFLARPSSDWVRLEDPARELRIEVFEAEHGGAVEAAIAQAWQRAAPGFARAVQQTTRPPARRGWDEIVRVSYETGGAEKRAVFASGRRKGERVVVVLVDGTDAALDRRSAQLGAIIGAIEPPGVGDESFAGRTALPLTGERAAELTRFITESLARAAVPGASVAVVQGGAVVFEQGFGVRALGQKDAVNPGTRFMIGSMTKSLTSLLLAKLVDEGKLRWDAPLAELYPAFRLGDPEVAKKVDVRHSVCACTGLPRQDMEFLFEYRGATPETRFGELAQMKPTTGFGETFQYSNALVSAAGYVAAHVVEPAKGFMQAYTDVMQSRVFDPLAMKSTTFARAAAEKADHASPHGMTLDLARVVLPLAVEDAVVSVAPAGGAWSTAGDIARYLAFELAQGKDPQGATLVSEANLLARRQGMVKVSDDSSYGLALLATARYGVHLYGHGGATLGFASDMVFVPEADLGIVVLTNAQGGQAFISAVERRVFELVLGARDEARENFAFGLEQQRVASTRELAKIKSPPDEAWAAGLRGRFAAPGLGSLEIRSQGGRLMLDVGEWQAALGKKTESDGQESLALLDPPLAGLSLIPERPAGEPNGTASRLVLERPQQRYVFERQAAGAK